MFLVETLTLHSIGTGEWCKVIIVNFACLDDFKTLLSFPELCQSLTPVHNELCPEEVRNSLRGGGGLLFV